MILNCTNYDTALESLEKIFNVSKSVIISVLQGVNPYDHLSQRPEDVLYDHMSVSYTHLTLPTNREV